MRKFLTIILLFFCFATSAKQNDSLSLNRSEKRLARLSANKSQYPLIGMWKQNYLVTGFATNKPVSKNSSDIKFQLSVALRLWNIKGKVDIFATYTQRSLWDFYLESHPFRENSYNPGFWAAWQVKDNLRLLFGLEHESNGQKGELSRSFNYATVACLYEPFDNWRFGGRAWYGYYERKTISHYFRYRGIMQLWGTFHTRNDRFSATVLVNPTVTFTRFNIQAEASWRMAKRDDWIPSLFVQYNYGYGETMIDYNRRSSKIRIGISLMHNKLNLY